MHVAAMRVRLASAFGAILMRMRQLVGRASESPCGTCLAGRAGCERWRWCPRDVAHVHTALFPMHGPSHLRQFTFRSWLVVAIGYNAGGCGIQARSALRTSGVGPLTTSIAMILHCKALRVRGSPRCRTINCAMCLKSTTGWHRLRAGDTRTGAKPNTVHFRRSTRFGRPRA